MPGVRCCSKIRSRIEKRSSDLAIGGHQLQQAILVK